MKKYIVGIDEVGRGALAGPVVVAAIALPKAWKSHHKIKDSKALTPPARRELVRWVKKMGLSHVIARVYPNVIDRINIAKSADLAAYRALGRLFRDLGIKGSKDVSVYLDGGLYIKNRRHQQNQSFRIRTVVRGDQKFISVKLASVVAKVNRDRYMTRLNWIHPGYSFHIHKGYGTRVHYKAIRKYGPSEVHRLTFVKKYLKMK